MSELTLESLARRLEEVERRLNEKATNGVKDWRMAAGMFTGREFSNIIDEEARKIREADREEVPPGVRGVILLDTDHLTVLKFNGFRKSGVKIDTMDLKMACIAVANNAFFQPIGVISRKCRG